MKLDARVTKVNSENNNIEALGTVTINDEVYLNNIRVINGENGLFVAMPNRKTNKVDAETGRPEYAEFFHAITAEARESLVNVVLSAFSSEDGKATVTLENVTDEINFKAGRGVHVYQNPDNNVIGIGSVVLNGSFALNCISVVEGSNGKFASFPSYKTNKVGDDGNPIYQYYFNMKKEIHQELSNAIVKGYDKSLEKLNEKKTKTK